MLFKLGQSFSITGFKRIFKLFSQPRSVLLLGCEFCCILPLNCTEVHTGQFLVSNSEKPLLIKCQSPQNASEYWKRSCWFYLCCKAPKSAPLNTSSIKSVKRLTELIIFTSLISLIDWIFLYRFLTCWWYQKCYKRFRHPPTFRVVETSSVIPMMTVVRRISNKAPSEPTSKNIRYLRLNEDTWYLATLQQTFPQFLNQLFIFLY